MRSLSRLSALALAGLGLALSLAGSPVTAAEGDAPVSVRRALFRVPSNARRQAVALNLRFDGFAVAPGYDLATDGLTLSVAGVDLLAIPAESGRIRQRGDDRFRYRMRSGRQRVRLALDTGIGTLRLRMIGVDVSGLAEADPDDAAVTLTIGEQVFRTTVDFRTRRTIWAHRAPRVVRRRPGPIPLPPPTGDGNLVRVGAGGHSAVEQAQDMVAANQSELDSLWALLGSTALAKPTVDFQRDVVVASFIGVRPSSGYGVAFISAEAQSTGDVVVKRSSFKPGINCIVLTVITNPWAVATVTKPSGGAVRFEAGVPLLEAPCPGRP